MTAVTCCDKLTGTHFVAPFAAQQRCKFIKYKLHRSNNAQHNSQFHRNGECFLSLLSLRH